MSCDSNSVVEESHFQQQNFLFLFDKELQFSARNDVSENQLTPDDYLKMKTINRRELCQFIAKFFKQDVTDLQDEQIDEKFKVILSKGSNG
jgi:hypothetical protein